MGDPFSIAAGAVGIVAAGVQLSSSLYDICEKISTAQNDIENIAGDLSFFVVIVDELSKIFQSPKRVYSPDLETSVRKIIERCRTLFKQIKRMIGKTADVPKLQLKAKVAWVFRESKVRETRANLDSLKSTLGLILQTLRLVKDERQEDRDERNVLANLLRSQRHSVRVLRSLEEEQAKVPNDLARKPSGLTTANADTLSEAVPTAPMVSLKEENAAKYRSDARDWRSLPVMHISDFERSLGDLYPIWKQQVLENVDFLLQTWTKSTTSQPQGPSKEAKTDPFIPDEEFKKIKDTIERQTKAIEESHIPHEVSQKTINDRLQKLEDRLRKREKGWLDIDDAALVRLETEIRELREKSVICEAEIASCVSRRNELEAQLQSATSACIQRSNKARKSKINIPVWKTSSPDLKQKDDPSYAPSNSAKPSLYWLDDACLDESDEEPNLGDGPKAEIAELPGDLPEQPANSSRNPGLKYPDRVRATRQTSNPDNPPSHPSTAPSQSHRSPIPSAAVADSNTETTRACQRHAWKPPQAFLTGSNTFSDVLNSVKHPQLWFTASQDAYLFYLRARATPFYTIHLVPNDLSSYETSKVEWTVIQKPWATHKALRVTGFPYVEDSVGFMWIRKDLNWYQIHQLFEFSCGLLDNAMHDSSRNILIKRSTSGKKPSHERSFLAPLTSWEGKNDIHSVVYGCHPVFFHAEDEELQRRRKRSKSMEFMRSST